MSKQLHNSAILQFNRYLVTGASGFIGYHLTKRLLKEGKTVIGLDNINDYYDVNLKYARLEQLGVEKGKIAEGKRVGSQKFNDFVFIKGDLKDRELIEEIFEENEIDVVVNLAAQAGVRYSLENPHAYIDSNVVGFLNILEGCRNSKVKHLVFASSSSVYGLNEKMPLSTHDNVDHPVSLYAATKKSNELMAHTYSHLYGLPCTGLRFFTVYGPWGRPDMALFLFTKAAIAGKQIDVFNYGEMVRDFTYVDDIVEGVCRVANNIPKGDEGWSTRSPDPSRSKGPYRIYNIGNNNPVKLMDFIAAIEEELSIKIEKNLMEIQPGDVPKTFADVADLENDIGYRPSTTVEEGIHEFIRWYKGYYGLEVKGVKGAKEVKEVKGAKVKQ